MGTQFASLQSIEGDHKITKETDYEFLYHLQNALLLALKEQGRLTATQYRYAEEKLKQQRRDWARKMDAKGESK